MTRDEFIRLSTTEQLTAIWSLLQDRGSIPISGPPSTAGTGAGLAPKFDTMIFRQGGMVQYASETDLNGLIFWRDRSAQPPSDPKYAESNAKMVKALDYWIAYRQGNPYGQWVGERNHERVTAEAPTDKPKTYMRGAPTAAPAVATPTLADSDDDIPFIWNVSCDPEERWHRAPRDV